MHPPTGACSMELSHFYIYQREDILKICAFTVRLPVLSGG